METLPVYSWAEPDEFEGINAFLVDTYGANSIQALPGRCRWLFFENPQGLHVSTCRSGGKLVAVCGHLAQRVPWEGGSITAGFGVDFMVTKEWRRRGIGRKFLEMRLERFPLSLSLGQSREMSGLYRSLDAVDLGSLYLGIHRRRPSVALHPKVMVRNNYAWLKSLNGLHPRDGSTAEMGDPQGSAALASDPEWYRWRYCSRPYGDYFSTRFPAVDSAALAVSRNATDYEVIVDVYGRSADRPFILAAVAQRSSQPESRFLFAGDKLRDDCARAGFWVRPHPARVVAMTADARLREQLQPGILDLMSGSSDADLLRIPARA